MGPVFVKKGTHQDNQGSRIIFCLNENKQEPFYYEISVYYTLIDSSKQPKIIKISFEIYDLVKENDIIFFFFAQISRNGTKYLKKGPKRDQFFSKVPKRDQSPF